MSLTEKLDFLVTMNPDSVTSGFEKIGSSAESNMKKAESSVARLSATVTKIGAAGVGVGGLLTQMASGDIEAANQLHAAIGQVGQSYSEFADKIDKAAESQVKYGHTDEQTKGALTTLTLAFNDTGKALDEMQLVTDLAARKNISLGDAATLVAKAHGGAGRMFKEFGIQVQTNADGTKNYDGALTELAQKLSGQASASADTWGGRLKALRAEVENHVSEFGQKYGPAILAVSAGLTVLGSVSSGVTSIIGRMKAAHEAAAVAAEGQAAAEEKSRIAALASAHPYAALAIGLAAVGVAMYEGIQNSTQLSYNLDSLSKNADKLGTQDIKTILEPLQMAGKSMKDFGDEMAQKSIPNALAFADGMDRAGVSSADFRAGIDQAKTSMQNNADAATQQANAINDTKDAFKGAKDSSDALTKSLDAQKTASMSLLGADIAVPQAELAVKDAIDKVTEASKESTDGKTKSETAERDLSKARLDAISAIDNQAQAVAKQAQAQAQANGAPIDGAAAQHIYMQSLQDTANSLAPGSYLQTQLQLYIAQLQQTNGYFSAHIDADVTEAQAKLNELRSQANAGLIINVAPGTHLNFDTGGLVPGPLGAAQRAVVHGGEFVLTAAQVNALKSGGLSLGGAMAGGGGNNYYITVDGANMSADQLVSAIKAWEQRNGTSWRN